MYSRQASHCTNEGKHAKSHLQWQCMGVRHVLPFAIMHVALTPLPFILGAYQRQLQAHPGCCALYHICLPLIAVDANVVGQQQLLQVCEESPQLLTIYRKFMRGSFPGHAVLVWHQA